MQKILLIVNSKASQGAESYEKIKNFFTLQGIEVIRGDCKSPEDYKKIIKKHAHSIDVVVAGGGDGTLQCVAEALIDTKTPLGIIPLGTANNVARSLGIPFKLEDACKIILNSHAKPIDLASVNNHIFISVMGIGLSTFVHEEVPHQAKKRWKALSYFLQAFKSIKKIGHGFTAQIVSEDQTFRVRAAQITVCNAKFYGAYFKVSKDASLDDGLLHLSVVEAKKYLRAFLQYMLPGEPAPTTPALKLLKSKSFEIQTHPLMKVDVEGSPKLKTPVRVKILPQAIYVMLPKKAND